MIDHQRRIQYKRTIYYKEDERKKYNNDIIPSNIPQLWLENYYPAVIHSAIKWIYWDSVIVFSSLSFVGCTLVFDRSCFIHSHSSHSIHCVDDMFFLFHCSFIVLLILSILLLPCLWDQLVCALVWSEAQASR